MVCHSTLAKMLPKILRGLEPRSPSSGPFLFLTAFAASQWKELLLGAGTLLWSFSGSPVCARWAIITSCHCCPFIEWLCLSSLRKITLPPPNRVEHIINQHLKALLMGSKNRLRVDFSRDSNTTAGRRNLFLGSGEGWEGSYALESWKELSPALPPDCPFFFSLISLSFYRSSANSDDLILWKNKWKSGR